MPILTSYSVSGFGKSVYLFWEKSENVLIFIYHFVILNWFDIRFVFSDIGKIDLNKQLKNVCRIVIFNSSICTAFPGIITIFPKFKKKIIFDVQHASFNISNTDILLQYRKSRICDTKIIFAVVCLSINDIHLFNNYGDYYTMLVCNVSIKVCWEDTC